MIVRLKSRVGSCLCIFLVATLALLAACQPPDVAVRKPTVIRIAGATAMQPVLYELTTAFSRQHAAVLFEVAGGGSTIGEERLLAGQIELAASTLISPTVSNPLLQSRGSPAVIRAPIGLDGLAIIVHQSNPVEDLTVTQLQALYNGRVLTWTEVGGPLDEVLLISREDGSGSRQLFDARIMGEERVSLTAIVMPTNADVVDYVAKHPNAVGYVSRAYVVAAIDQAYLSATAPADPAARAANAPAVKVVALESELPTQQAIQRQSYSLIQPLYLVSRTRPTGWLQQFIDFPLSPAGQTIVARYHGRVR
jgi:phosphate transport system substrate-binding protein